MTQDVTLTVTIPEYLRDDVEEYLYHSEAGHVLPKFLTASGLVTFAVSQFLRKYEPQTKSQDRQV